MVTLDVSPSETVAAFLVRCLAEAQRTGQPVRAKHCSVIFVVYPWMTTDALVNAWITAKTPLRRA